MLIVGAYPDGLSTTESAAGPAIPRLNDFLRVIAPPNVGLHLLPFYPSSGDSGFAVNDWFTVRDDLGTWVDIAALASSRRVIVDGIYNHVGVDHAWVQQFLRSPDTISDLLHAYQIDSDKAGPLSPRGQAVLRRYEAGGSVWHLWQTFSEAAVDIRLDNPRVLREIDNHLQLLAGNGVWGVRLDAVAYYSKFLGSKIRHNPGAAEIAANLAHRVESHGLRLLAQLDCDEDGRRYFSRADQSHYVINDFTFTALLSLAVISEDPAPLARHLATTAAMPRICLRAPRTHDGILLRSGLLRADDRARLIAAVETRGIKIRMSDGAPYELNCSAPFLYSLFTGRELLPDVVELAVAVTGLTNGWTYLYLPFLLGHIPEDADLQKNTEPRDLNRSSVPRDVQAAFLKSARHSRMRNLLTFLIEDATHAEPEQRPRSDAVSVGVAGQNLLSLTAPGGKLCLFANFSRRRVVARPTVAGELVFGNRVTTTAIHPLGYGIWKS